jgi:putative ABC transport system permease protein
MAWRDSRASRRRLVLFSFSVVLGIAALVAIGSLGTNLERGIDDQAKGLLGADLIITGRSPISEAAQQHVAALATEIAREISFSSMMAFPRANNLTRLVNVRATEGNFPFYGDFLTAPADAPAKLRSGGEVVIVEETLLRQFDTKIGDQVKIGNTMFTVVGALQKLPGESSALSATIAPRALIPKAALDATGLAERNVLVRHRTMLKLPPLVTPESVEREMRRQFRSEGLGYDTVAERKRNLGRALDNIENFLGLVGFIALFLGAIGIASAIHVYVRQKIPTVAVLRCLGATARQSFGVYLVQGIALGIFGAVVGAALGVTVQIALPHLLADVLPFEVKFFIAWPAVARGMGAGLVICLLFTLCRCWPFGRCRRSSRCGRPSRIASAVDATRGKSPSVCSLWWRSRGFRFGRPDECETDLVSRRYWARVLRSSGDWRRPWPGRPGAGYRGGGHM